MESEHQLRRTELSSAGGAPIALTLVEATAKVDKA